ncbi:hypothetical protein D5366_08960 [Neokomagataea tanensis]|uniref:General secretion pathway protein GspM n=1 Tax=Neokomagataea tanensis TaxID=661191 RepID=A0A4Y6VA00_9PROT|nr:MULTISPECIES: type II secretion system protein GspM [Neokomagataea]QDH25316.1 hypothetical protein D5366_08960 [Neokomagataea tanensis]
MTFSTTSHHPNLPTGKRGRVYAVLLAFLCFVFGVLIVKTLISTYQNTQDTLTAQRAILARTQHLISTIPRLEKRAQQADTQMMQATPLLRAPSDDLASAQLQETVHTLSDALSLPLTSQEPLTLPRKGQFQTVALRIAFTAPWATTVQFLASLQQTQTPHLLTEDLQISTTNGIMPDDAAIHGQSVDVSLLIVALRSPDKTTRPSSPSSHPQNW